MLTFCLQPHMTTCRLTGNSLEYPPLHFQTKSSTFWMISNSLTKINEQYNEIKQYLCSGKQDISKIYPVSPLEYD